MLSELQQKSVWEGWLASEIRANYFADLCHQYQVRQQVITWLILAFSSGAFLALVADWLPRGFGWVRPTLAAVTAGLSLWSLVAQNQKHATDCSELHFGWNKLSAEYEALWDDMYSVQAAARLAALRDKTAELSKSGTHLPNRRALMEKWEDHVIQHHGVTVAA